MRKTILCILLLYPLLFSGQNSTNDIVGAIDGSINVSMYGGAVYSIPLELPGGVNGMQPSIGIVYNSQSGNGLLGYGWNVNGISSITRTGSTLYHNGKVTAVDFSDDDCFLLDGQRLILVAISGNNYEYKTENDEFSKVLFIKENGYFSKCEVRLENGNIIKYGYTDNSKLMASDGNNVIKWMVNSISDRSGNTVSYVYETSGNNSDLYIKRINYTSNVQAGFNSQFQVLFSYSDNRFDNYHTYIAGNKVLCDRLLTKIDISNQGSVIKSYDFSYYGNTGFMYNLLKEITLSKGNYAYNPTVIQWNTVNSDINNNSLYSEEINSSILDEFTFVGDFNGDGYSDLLTVPYKPQYGYNGNVTAKVYLNDMNGDFNSTPNYTITLAQSLEWLHIVDVNGDGYDDVVAQNYTKTFDGGDFIYNTTFIVYESQNGTGFNCADSYSLDGSYLVRAGDFIGEGQNSLLIIKLEILEGHDDTYFLYDHPLVLHYDDDYALDTVSDLIFDNGVVVVGDYNGDGKTEIALFESQYCTFYSFYKQNGLYRMSSSYSGFNNFYGVSYFAGDFNSDGKSDILYNDIGNNKYIAFSTGTGFTYWAAIDNTTLEDVNLPLMRTYRYSLGQVSSNSQYGVNISDIDGDGKTDIIFYDGDNRPIFYRNFSITNASANTGRFKIEYVAENSDICFKNQYFTMGNFLGQNHVSFIALDPHNPNTTTDDEVKLFSFPSTAERFSVKSITDGMGKSISIDYDYLMPGRTDFYSFSNRPYVNDVKPCPLPILAMKSYTENIGNNSYKTKFKYGNVLLHKTGKGFVNFENVEKSSYINNTIVSKEIGWYETTTTGADAVALPQCDSVYVYNNGLKILKETNHYTFQNVRSDRQQNSAGFGHIIRPAMVSNKVKRYDPDLNGHLLSVEITEYTYNYQNNGSYSDTYSCTGIMTGSNATDCNSASACGYRANTQISYNNNNYTTWIINRKSEELSVTEFLNKPSISRKTTYTYSTFNPFLITTKTVYPSQNLTDPLTVRYIYQYDSSGNVTSETITAPYGTQNEPSIVTFYTYNNHRLVSRKTKDPYGLYYQEQYVYDKYDRVTSYTGSNGLTTSYTYRNPFGTYVITETPDNIITEEIVSWANHSHLTPTGTSYSKYVSTTGKPTTQTFYDASGNALRSTTLNHDMEPVIVDVCYNDKQLPTQKSDPYLMGDNPQWTTYQYDGLGRPITTTAPDGTVVSNYYNGLTTTTTTTSGNTSHTVSQTTNYLGWVTNNTDASANTVAYSYYSDGKVASMTTSGGDVMVSISYDNAGNRITLDDPDYGEISSVYDAYGRLVRQTTPKQDRYDYTYDALGRITRKGVLGDATTTLYHYNESSNKGTLASVIHTGQTLTYTYDRFDRLIEVTETRPDSTYITSYEYNNNGQISSKTYPSGYKVYYTYFSNGTNRNIKDIRGNILWQTDDINPNGQLVEATTGNGAVITNTYNPLTHLLSNSVTSNNIQNFAYTFDGFGNLTSRTDSIGTIKTESFTYDNLDRLTGITMNNVSSSMVYDSYGRMTGKQKEGSVLFENALFGRTKPHALRVANTNSEEFPKKQIVKYNSLDKVDSIVQSRKVASFTYGYDTQRVRMHILDSLTGKTLTKDYVGGCEFIEQSGSKKVHTYLTGPYGVFAVVVKNSLGESINYIYKDHLGSWTTVTDSVGTVLERLSYDAWGNPRNASTWSGPMLIEPRFDRGFTGHEHLYVFNLINMNGRMYDPMMSSFLSPDNYMQDPTSQQGFNRYAYCRYNPLKYVDPSGEQYFGWDPGLMYRVMQEIRGIILNAWYQHYDSSMASNKITQILASALYSCGLDSGGNGSGNHGGETIGVDLKTFKDKCKELGITPGQAIPKDKITNEFIKKFQETFFPNAPMEYVKEFLVEGLDKDFFKVSGYDDDKYAYGRTKPGKIGGLFSGNSYVYFNNDVVLEPEALFYTMGHEFVHVSQYAALKGADIVLLNDLDFINTMEFFAYSWESSVGGISHMSPDKYLWECINYYSDLYNLNYINYKWTSHLIHP